MKANQIVNQPLAMGNGLGNIRKEWILSAIGAAGSIASSIFGGAQASKAAEAAERKQRISEAKEQAWYQRNYNQSYVDTAAGQNLIRRAKDFAKNNWRKASGAQAVAGGTDAATAIAKEAGNKMVGDTISNMAATDTARKAQVDAQHRQAEAKFAQMDMDRETTRAQNITNAASAASNALMSVGAAVEQASVKKPDLVGAGNNSKVVEYPQQATVPVGSLSDGHQPIYEDADTLKRLMQSAG